MVDLCRIGPRRIDQRAGGPVGRRLLQQGLDLLLGAGGLLDPVAYFGDLRVRRIRRRRALEEVHRTRDIAGRSGVVRQPRLCT